MPSHRARGDYLPDLREFKPHRPDVDPRCLFWSELLRFLERDVPNRTQVHIGGKNIDNLLPHSVIVQPWHLPPQPIHNFLLDMRALSIESFGEVAIVA